MVYLTVGGLCDTSVSWSTLLQVLRASAQRTVGRVVNFPTECDTVRANLATIEQIKAHGSRGYLSKVGVHQFPDQEARRGLADKLGFLHKHHIAYELKSLTCSFRGAVRVTMLFKLRSILVRHT